MLTVATDATKFQPRHGDLKAASLTACVSSVVSDLHVVLFSNANIFASACGFSWTGPLPPVTGFQALKQLILDHNGFSGTLPSSWAAALPILAWIGVSDNKFSGTVPAEWSHASAFTQLAHYSAGNNIGLRGPLPTFVGSMSWYGVGYNSHTGTLPSSLATVWPNLTYIWLTSNPLQGSLPAAWSSSALRNVFLQNCSISGNLPPEWGSLGNMKQTYLDDNSLAGTLPAQLGDKALAASILNISIAINKLSGTIPVSWTNMSHLRISSGLSPAGLVLAGRLVLQGNNDICGSIPTSLNVDVAVCQPAR